MTASFFAKTVCIIALCEGLKGSAVSSLECVTPPRVSAPVDTPLPSHLIHSLFLVSQCQLQWPHRRGQTGAQRRRGQQRPHLLAGGHGVPRHAGNTTTASPASHKPASPERVKPYKRQPPLAPRLAHTIIPPQCVRCVPSTLPAKKLSIDKLGLTVCACGVSWCLVTFLFIVVSGDGVCERVLARGSAQRARARARCERARV